LVAEESEELHDPQAVDIGDIESEYCPDLHRRSRAGRPVLLLLKDWLEGDSVMTASHAKANNPVIPDPPRNSDGIGVTISYSLGVQAQHT
jgi:hypothetical protein